MNSSPVYLASDIHLGAVPEATEAAFRRWLRHVAERTDTLVLNGDLFDYWFEYRSVIPRGYTRILGLLAELVDQGMTIHLLGGNHDWWGGSFLEEEVGVRFHRDPVQLELAGHRTLLAHGDGLGPGDRGYKALKALLRSGPFNWFFRWLHPDLGSRIARQASKTEGRGAPTRGERARAALLRRWALDALAGRPEVDLVVLGHTHVPALETTPDGRHYLNCGDWVYHRTYAVLEEAAPPRLMAWGPEETPVPWRDAGTGAG